jgi:hypothetical protein
MTSIGALLKEYDKQFCSIQHTSKDELSDITSAVTELVSNLLDVGLETEIKEELSGESNITFDGHFKNLFINSRLVPVGSFSEGTKAICPDEFDFMFMFFVGQLTIDRGCGPDRLKIKSDENGFWKQFLGPQSNVKSLGYHSVHHHLDNMLHLVEKQMQRKGNVVCVPKSTGKLQYWKLTDQRLDLLWVPRTEQDTFCITIDIMPAIICDFDQIHDFLTESKFPGEYLSLAREEGCCLVPKACSHGCRDCFQISLATSERHLMKDLNEVHKSCYRILKCVFSMARKFPQPGEYIDLTSYKIKNVIMGHVYGDRCNMATLYKCLNSIFELLSKSYENVSLPMFLLREKCCLCRPDNRIFVYKLDSITESWPEDAPTTDAFQCLVWFEFNRRLILLVQRYLKCVSSIPSFTTIKLHQFVDVFQKTIQYYTREHKAEYPRFDKHSNIELSKLRDKLFIPVIFVIEQKIVKFLEFQTNISFPFHTRLIHTDCDSSSHNESTVVHDKTDVEYGDQSTVMCSSTSSETSDCLKSSKNIKNADSLLMVDFLSSAFSLCIGKDVYSKNTGMKILQCDNFVLRDLLANEVFTFKIP